jgi:hypothetical protein
VSRTAVADADEPAVNLDSLSGLNPPRPLKVDPARMTVNHDGFAFRSYLVRLPAGVTAEGLKESSLWARVQASQRPLRKFDQLVIVDHAETWFAEAVVGAADREQVALCRLKITTLPTRYDALPQDAKFKIEWTGHGYSVIRKSDGHQMGVPTPTIELASAELARQYPRSPVA